MSLHKEQQITKPTQLCLPLHVCVRGYRLEPRSDQLPLAGGKTPQPRWYWHGWSPGKAIIN